jgi:hypothetical protein
VADYTVIAEVGQSILAVLWEEMQADPQISTLIDNEDRRGNQSGNVHTGSNCRQSGEVLQGRT